MNGKLFVGNWKMNGSRASIKKLLADILRSEQSPGGQLAVCAPYPYLALCAHMLSGSQIQLGAQNLSEHHSGAYTGEVSAAMLREFGCAYVLVGHSERRAYHHENAASIVAKVERALEAGLIPIVCVGETLQQRESGLTRSVLRQQIGEVTQELCHGQLTQVVFAYEPVWAIGTGISAQPELAQDAHATIRRSLADYRAAAARILYGGSIRPANAAQLLTMPDIDGALVGGASLTASDFLAIAAADQTPCTPLPTFKSTLV